MKNHVFDQRQSQSSQSLAHWTWRLVARPQCGSSSNPVQHWHIGHGGSLLSHSVGLVTAPSSTGTLDREARCYGHSVGLVTAPSSQNLQPATFGGQAGASFDSVQMTTPTSNPFLHYWGQAGPSFDSVQLIAPTSNPYFHYLGARGAVL